ncbi:hypothetical protein EJB05_10749, partial [Eragrostis curvula]
MQTLLIPAAAAAAVAAAPSFELPLAPNRVSVRSPPPAAVKTLWLESTDPKKNVSLSTSPPKTSSTTAAAQSFLIPDAPAAAPPSDDQPSPALCRVSVRSPPPATVTTLRREKDPKKRVVITGMGVVSVFGNDADAFYDRLLAGESGVVPIDRFDASAFPTRFAAQIRDFYSEGLVDGRNGRRLDDCHRYALVAAKKALESAALAVGSRAMNKIDKERAGVVVGSGIGGVTEFSAAVEALAAEGPTEISSLAIPLMTSNAASALIAMDRGIGFMGPNYSVSAAGATANHCLHSAADQIRLGRADVMIAGGTDAAVVPAGLGAFAASGALSQRNDDPGTASRPWDRDRDGFVLGEGAGVLVMESLEHAMLREAPIFAEYLGGAATCDAYHLTNPRPDGRGIALCINRSLEDAGVAPEEVNYINAHATSSILGDLAELEALKQVFKAPNQMIKMNATKALHDRALPRRSWRFGGNRHYQSYKYRMGASNYKPNFVQHLCSVKLQNPDPACPFDQFDTVHNVKQQHKVHVGISNSFGFGGHNSVVVFAPYQHNSFY